MTVRRKVHGHYDQGPVFSYCFGSVDFGAGDSAYAIQPPYGVKNGRVMDIHVAVTETFNAVTTAGYVRVGHAGDPDAYAEMNMGAAAATDGYSSTDNNIFVLDAGTAVAKSVIDLDRDHSAALDQLEVAFIAPTGGAPAGIGVPTIFIQWW